MCVCVCAYSISSGIYPRRRRPDDDDDEGIIYW